SVTRATSRTAQLSPGPSGLPSAGGLRRVATAPGLAGKRPSELDLRVVADLGARAASPDGGVPGEQSDAADRVPAVLQPDHQPAEAVAVPGPAHPRHLLDRVVEVACLAAADVAHDLGVADLHGNCRRVGCFRPPEHEPLGLDHVIRNAAPVNGEL